MRTKKRILMVAAENDALPGAKVGGVGDVIRDLPIALTKQGYDVDVIVPSYGKLARLEDNKFLANFEVFHAGESRLVSLIRHGSKQQKVGQYILHHFAFSPKGEHVYCDDPDWEPFATDANKFSFFCACVAKLLETDLIDKPQILHCHDWHTAFLPILRRFSSNYKGLKSLKIVFTIHNLAMQGVRPLRGHYSAFETWFQNLHYDGRDICDRINPHCVNPMRAAIRLSDLVNTVSPTYAKEIQQMSKHQNGIYGGEGLEQDLKNLQHDGKLFGILNGCDYSVQAAEVPDSVHLQSLLENDLLEWVGKARHLDSAHWIAERRAKQLVPALSDRFVMTSVGRITDQKARLLNTNLDDGRSVLENILDTMGERGIFFMLGSGDPQLEDFFTRLAGAKENFLFLKGYSNRVSDIIYSLGDLFLMPSSFEPCGISQLLAMRSEQPCLVNAVGGLKDTVHDMDNGFVFSGRNIHDQAKSLVSRFGEVFELFHKDKKRWNAVKAKAASTRVSWDKCAEAYVELIFNPLYEQAICDQPMSATKETKPSLISAANKVSKDDRALKARSQEVESKKTTKNDNAAKKGNTKKP